ncbi:MAG: DUF2189 domain-containing protein, partial [Candidatus Competibacteraceae bacterium]|nr:DUF2189 domain-containing protein [Candidatus Competibacteraceae bacterium]
MAEAYDFKRSLVKAKIRRVDLEQPWEWVMAGWKDLRTTPLASIAYGLIFTIMGYNLTALSGADFFSILTLASGFMLVGPFLAMGLYEMSRRREEGLDNGFSYAILAWRGKTLQLLTFGVILGLVMVIWARVAGVVYALTLAGSGRGYISDDPATLFFTGDGLAFLIPFFAVGGVIALLVFAASAVSIPMMLDRDTDLATAVATSMVAVRANIGPMIIWGVIIVLFTG